MKTTKIIHVKGLRVSLAGLAFMLVAITACDKLESDSIPNVSKDGNFKQLYVPSNGSVLMDINSLADANQQVTISVPTTTNEGTLTDLGSGILEYKSKSAQSGRDGFEITITDGNNNVKKDSVILIIEDDPKKLPKGIYPNQDVIFGVKNAIPVEFDVLANDYLSELTPDDITLSIFNGESLPPYFGEAGVSAGKITYTANSSFKSADKIIYKASSKSDPSIFAFGQIYLTNEILSDFNVNDDTMEYGYEFTQIKIDGLANDQLTKPLMNFAVIISEVPSKGTVYVENDQFVYTPTNLASNGFEDSFKYTVTIDGVSKTAKVTIRVKI